MSEKKLEEIMSKDKSLVRRVSDIEVEEVTLTKKGALGDEADAVILYKEEDEKTDAVTEDEAAILEKETTEEVAEEVAELEKEEVAEDTKDGNIEMDFDSAISFIQKGELSDEQKQAVLDTALVIFDAADLEKEEVAPEVAPEVKEKLIFETDQRLSPEQVAGLQKQIKEQHEACCKSGEPMIVHSGVKLVKSSEFPTEAMELLKSIHGLLEKELPEQFKKKKKKSEDSVDDKEDKKPEFLKKEETSVVDNVEQLLRKSQEARLAKERSDKEAAVHNKLNEMSSVLSGLTEKFTETQRRLDRECGIDA